MGLGTTRRKVEITSVSIGALRIKISAQRFLAKNSGKLCKGKVNHKCLFNKGDTLDLLCPETVQKDGRATVFVHRAYNGKNTLLQRNINEYSEFLIPTEVGEIEFPVTKIGRVIYGECEECYCIEPAPGSHLWIDKRLATQDKYESELDLQMGIGFNQDPCCFYCPEWENVEPYVEGNEKSENKSCEHMENDVTGANETTGFTDGFQAMNWNEELWGNPLGYTDTYMFGSDGKL